jgi:hypothetical protein
VMQMNVPKLVLAWACLSAIFVGEAVGQAEVTAWGNLTGIRLDGHLMAFESSLLAVGVRGGETLRTAKERQQPRYSRDGARQTVTTQLDSLEFRQVVTDVGRGAVTVELETKSKEKMAVHGVYFALQIPTDLAGGGKFELLHPQDESFAGLRPMHGSAVKMSASGILLTAPHRQVRVTWDEPGEILVNDIGGGRAEVRFTLISGAVEEGLTVERSLNITATGDPDTRPVSLTLDTSRQGRPFEGLGGNFRIQNPEVDPAVIRYNLENMKVTWGRVEMPWRFWHPDEEVDPIEAARAGNLHVRVRQAMEMAQDLDRRGIPVMQAAWSGPSWAMEGTYSPGQERGGLRGLPLNQAKAEQIYASITAYIRYLQDEYGVKTVAFSFNESDLGINVRQTAKEHAKLIRELGAYFNKSGLETKLLLGDTADGNGYAFTYAAMNDPATHPFIHAVSFHSWRGWEDETLRQWADIATRLNLPLVVGEGSTDAAAYRYPAIFEELVYSLEEINLYTRILAICQPQSIIQWQLTGDYSILAGGGVYGNREEPLRPTRRFWNLKQLADMPAGLFAMPVAGDRALVTAAALGDNARGEYVVHLVNNGAAREAVLTGLPGEVKELDILVTDERRQIEKGKRIPVIGGQARFLLQATSFTSLHGVSER